MRNLLPEEHYKYIDFDDDEVKIFSFKGRKNEKCYRMKPEHLRR